MAHAPAPIDSANASLPCPPPALAMGPKPKRDYTRGRSGSAHAGFDATCVRAAGPDTGTRAEACGPQAVSVLQKVTSMPPYAITSEPASTACTTSAVRWRLKRLETFCGEEGASAGGPLFPEARRQQKGLGWWADGKRVRGPGDRGARRLAPAGGKRRRRARAPRGRTCRAPLGCRLKRTGMREQS